MLDHTHDLCCDLKIMELGHIITAITITSSLSRSTALDHTHDPCFDLVTSQKIMELGHTITTEPLHTHDPCLYLKIMELGLIITTITIIIIIPFD